MPLEFAVQNGDSDGNVSVNDLVQQLQQQGEQVLGVSADGSMIKMQDATGEFSVSPQQVLQDLGWQVSGVKPKDASYDSINNDWRSSISALPSDAHKKAYLEVNLKNAGIENPTIVGSGRDWYAFDPEANKYVALTNNPEWDKSDVSEALVGAPRFAGSMLGGAGGAVLGGGLNPLTGAAGAALGGGLADTGTRAFLASRDPALKQIMQDDPMAFAKDIGVNMGYDAIGGALPGLPKAIGAMMGKGAGQSAKSLVQNGPISSLARGVGNLAEEGGRIVNKTARIADTKLGRDLVTPMLPGLGEANLVSNIAQLPGQAIRGSARGMGWLGQQKALSEAAPETAKNLVLTSKDLLRPSRGASNFTNEFSRAADKAANFLKGEKPIGKPMGGTTEDILGNLGEMFGGGRQTAKAAMRDAYTNARQYGISAQDAKALADEAAEEALPAASKTTREIGRKIGRGIQNVENFSKGVENFTTGTTSAMLKGVRAGSYATGKGGSALKNAAKIAQPLENRAYTQYGAEELYRPEISPSESWQNRRKRDKLGIILADQ